MKVKFLRPNSYSNFIRLLTDHYREGKIRGKNFCGPFSDFLLKGFDRKFCGLCTVKVDFVP